MDELNSAVETANDPHASKISPNDPRLLVNRPSIRKLRKDKLLAALAGLCVLITAGVLAASVPTSKPEGEDKPKRFTAAVPPEDVLKLPEPTKKPATEAEKLPELTTVPAIPADARASSKSQATGPIDTGPYSTTGLKRARIEAYWRARGAPISVDVGTLPEDPGVAAAPVNAQDSDAAHDERRDVASASAPLTDDQNMQGRKNDFLTQGARSDDGYLHTRLERPRSPYEVKAGTVIPASLITGINSDLPGPVVAQVRENVYDTVTGDYLLIPQGARLIASYDSMVAWGQERVLLCWHRLILPNGNSIALKCMPGADLAGAAGLTDQVDEHWWRIIKGAGVASLLSAATSAAAGSTTTYNPSLPQLWARGAADQIGTVGTQVTQRNIRVQPTITVRPGWSMNVMVTRDMILEPYDEESATF